MFKKLSLGVVIGLVVWSGGLCADTSRNVNLRQAAEQFVSAGKVAVVVGVEAYSLRSGLRPLDYAADDAQEMAKTLRQLGYNVQLLTNQQATRADVLDAIEQAGKAVSISDGTLLFFFSGHGFAEGQNNYLASYGTVSTHLQGSALRLDEVEQAIRQTHVKRAVMFVDACRNNPFVGKSVAQPSFLRQHSEGIKALYATKPGELSYETPQLGHKYLHKLK
ncbi:MAG: caspase family protein [Thiofilum sp.]|uniref:caspase family protein n=1 Tax=Thiofilum sp. TaxID=2212733 RepID=UPI0025DC44C5|nr:caspase family protein [Thiofilum sp.]MBK8451937.1 caspase family protein [Thiofilum sp.]